MPTQTLEEKREEQRKAAEAHAGSNGGGKGAEPGESLEGLAQQTGEEDDGQVFVMENGVKLGLSSLVKRGTPVHYEFKMDGKGMKGGEGMGLISFEDPERTLIVPGRGGKIVTDPTYGPDGVVKHVTVRQHFKPTMVYDSRTEAGQVALRGE